VITAMDRMTVDVPEGEVDGMIVKKFTITEEDARGVQAMRLAFTGRSIRPGTYTKLTERGAGIWMSDTPAEKRDHVVAVQKIEDLKAKRVLINGLGLGMVVQAALSFDHVERVDVVEADKRVIDLVGPHYLKDSRVRIHHADAFDKAKNGWAPGTRWDVVWSDIWRDLDADDLPEHFKLSYTYNRRSSWHGCWVHDDLLRRRDFERREDEQRRSWLS